MLVPIAVHAERLAGRAGVPYRPRGLARPRIGFALRLMPMLLMLWAAPTAATCGDYVVVRGETPNGGRAANDAGRAMRMAFPAHGFDGRVAGGMRVTRSGRDAPCDGPRCEKDRPVPDAPLSAPVRDSLGRHLVKTIVSIELLRPRPAARLGPRHRCVISPGYLDPIEPPPRS